MRTPPEEGSWIGVTLRNSAELDDEGNPTPVPGVTITVTDKDDQEVGSGVTDSTGRVYIAIPGNGTCFVPFHFREAAANLLTIDEIDPVGKIPEFKFCAVRIERADREASNGRR